MSFRHVVHLLQVVSIILEKIFTAEMNIYFQKYTWTLGPCQLDLLESCHSDHIQFYLYTKKSKKPVQLKLQDKKPPREFNPRWKTKILIHGYAGNLEFNGTALVRQAYLDHGSYNIIAVDWGRLVRLPCYPIAAINTWQAGKCTSEMIRHLIDMKTKGFRLSRLHIIGFSLGAHVAAFASSHLRKYFKPKIGRITGLDPALPFFASMKKSWKLEKEDAQFVDIIHTNSGVFGKIEASGHVDFYVNGGVLQPACLKAHNPPLCSHVISTLYYAESVMSRNRPKEEQFRAVSCPDFWNILLKNCEGFGSETVMGDACPTTTRGIYHVKTGATPPFASTSSTKEIDIRKNEIDISIR